jgi:tetratricopeptide (TPR) repeat protein
VKDKKHNRIFNASGHLRDEEIALCAEAMMNEKLLARLPFEVNSHFEKCSMCTERVTELYGIISNEPEVKERIADVISTVGYNSSNTKKRWRIFYSITAAACILVLVAFGSYHLFKPMSPDAIFAKSFKPYPNVVTTKGLNEKLLSAGMYYYDLAKYDSAVLFYNQILSGAPQNTEVVFFKGICLLSIGNANEAILNLNKVVSEDQSPYRNPARWYLALAFLISGDNEKTKETLSEIIKSNSTYSKDATRILKKLQ